MIRQFRLSSGTRRIAHDSVRRSGSAPAAPFARTRIVAEEDARPAAFQRLQPVKRGHHRLLIVHVARQAALAQGLAEVAGVRREHGSGSPKALPTKRPGAASASWKLGPDRSDGAFCSGEESPNCRSY
jgi:hypothetical protein